MAISSHRSSRAANSSESAGCGISRCARSTAPATASPSRSAKVDYTALPRAIFTTPPIATVGITEAEARRRGLDVDAITNDMTGWKVHAIAGDELARSKTIVERATGKLLGAQLCAPTAAD